MRLMCARSSEKSSLIMTSIRGLSRSTCTLIRGITHRESPHLAREETVPLDKGIINTANLSTREEAQPITLIFDTRALTTGPSTKLSLTSKFKKGRATIATRLKLKTLEPESQTVLAVSVLRHLNSILTF